MAAWRAVAPAPRRPPPGGRAQGAEVHDRYGAGPVRVGGQPGHRPTSKLAAAELATYDVAIPTLAGWTRTGRIGPSARGRRHRGEAARSRVLRRRRPPQLGGRSVVLRHHLDLPRDRRVRRAAPQEALQG